MILGNGYSLEAEGLQLYLYKGNIRLVEIGRYSSKEELQQGIEVCYKYLERVMYLYNLYQECDYLKEQEFLREFIQDVCNSYFSESVVDCLIEEFV